MSLQFFRFRTFFISAVILFSLTLAGCGGGDSSVVSQSGQESRGASEKSMASPDGVHSSQYAGESCTDNFFGIPFTGIKDCNDNCFPEYILAEWTGDNDCDVFANLNCAYFNFDGGDCGTSSTATPTTALEDLNEYQTQMDTVAESLLAYAQAREQVETAYYSEDSDSLSSGIDSATTALTDLETALAALTSVDAKIRSRMTSVARMQRELRGTVYANLSASDVLDFFRGNNGDVDSVMTGLETFKDNTLKVTREVGDQINIANSNKVEGVWTPRDTVSVYGKVLNIITVPVKTAKDLVTKKVVGMYQSAKSNLEWGQVIIGETGKTVRSYWRSIWVAKDGSTVGVTKTDTDSDPESNTTIAMPKGMAISSITAPDGGVPVSTSFTDGEITAPEDGSPTPAATITLSSTSNEEAAGILGDPVSTTDGAEETTATNGVDQVPSGGTSYTARYGLGDLHHSLTFEAPGPGSRSCSGISDSMHIDTLADGSIYGSGVITLDASYDWLTETWECRTGTYDGFTVSGTHKIGSFSGVVTMSDGFTFPISGTYNAGRLSGEATWTQPQRGYSPESPSGAEWVDGNFEMSFNLKIGYLPGSGQ